jgi:hypothetical protein
MPAKMGTAADDVVDDCYYVEEMKEYLEYKPNFMPPQLSSESFAKNFAAQCEECGLTMSDNNESIYVNYYKKILDSLRPGTTDAFLTLAGNFDPHDWESKDVGVQWIPSEDPLYHGIRFLWKLVQIRSFVEKCPIFIKGIVTKSIDEDISRIDLLRYISVRFRTLSDIFLENVEHIFIEYDNDDLNDDASEYGSDHEEDGVIIDGNQRMVPVQIRFDRIAVRVMAEAVAHMGRFAVKANLLVPRVAELLDIILAVLMATHPRLGRESTLLSQIPSEILEQMILPPFFHLSLA